MPKQGNFFTDRSAFKTIDRFRVIYLGLALFSFLLTEIGRNTYRPFIYSNNIDDFGFADSVGNSGGIMVQIFFSLALLNSPREKVYNVVGFLVIGYILYEILQPYLPRGTFDWKDIYGTFIGGLIALLILFLLRKMVKNKVIHIFE